MRTRVYRKFGVLLLALSLVAASCEGEDGDDADAGPGDWAGEESDDSGASEEAASPVSLLWTPVDPEAMLLDAADLDGWDVRTEPEMVDDGELRSDLLLPCDMAAPSGFGTEGAANEELYHADDNILVWHTVARQPLADAERFLSDVSQAAEDCDEPWTRQISEGEHELRMVDGPQVTMRADNTWTYTIEWRGTDNTVRWITTVVHVRCHRDVARLAISHPPEVDGTVVTIDELTRQATTGLQKTKAGSFRLCANLLRRMVNTTTAPTVPANWRTSFEPLPFSQRPAALNSLSRVRAVNWTTPPEATLTDFLDIDNDGDLDPADVALIAMMWLAFPDALVSNAPEDVKAVLLAGRELFDATPVGACISAGVHMLVASEGLVDLDPLELIGCGASFFAKVGAQSLRSLKVVDDPRWVRAVDDAADLVTEDNVAAVETTYSKLRVLTSSEVRQPFGEQCGFGFAGLGPASLRAACLVAPALEED